MDGCFHSGIHHRTPHKATLAATCLQRHWGCLTCSSIGLPSGPLACVPNYSLTRRSPAPALVHGHWPRMTTPWRKARHRPRFSVKRQLCPPPMSQPGSQSTPQWCAFSAPLRSSENLLGLVGPACRGPRCSSVDYRCAYHRGWA